MVRNIPRKCNSVSLYFSSVLPLISSYFQITLIYDIQSVVRRCYDCPSPLYRHGSMRDSLCHKPGPNHNNSRIDTEPPNWSEQYDRLMHFKFQKAECENFIKEEAFSPDGRVLCSPYGNQTRLLAFNEHCQELVDCEFLEPQALEQVCLTEKHNEPVLATKFSPQGYLLATGCYGGKVKFHQPVF